MDACPNCGTVWLTMEHGSYRCGICGRVIAGDDDPEVEVQMPTAQTVITCYVET